MGRRYPAEFRTEAVQFMQSSGQSIRVLAADLGIAEQTLRNNVYRDYWKLPKRAGLPMVRFHDLRHTAATLLLSQKVDLRTIMEVLDHSQFTLTMDTYSHVLPSLKADAAQWMNVVLGPVLED